MKLTVSSKISDTDYVCIDENGIKRTIDLDLKTDGSYEGDIKKGDIFYVEELSPYVEIVYSVTKIGKK